MTCNELDSFASIKMIFNLQINDFFVRLLLASLPRDSAANIRGSLKSWSRPPFRTHTDRRKRLIFNDWVGLPSRRLARRPTIPFTIPPHRITVDRANLMRVHVFAVVIQPYEAEADNEYVIRGNAAIMKCEIPSYVSDFIVVDMWLDSDGGSYYRNNDSYGICILAQLIVLNALGYLCYFPSNHRICFSSCVICSLRFVRTFEYFFLNFLLRFISCRIPSTQINW